MDRASPSGGEGCPFESGPGDKADAPALKVQDGLAALCAQMASSSNWFRIEVSQASDVGFESHRGHNADAPAFIVEQLTYNSPDAGLIGVISGIFRNEIWGSNEQW